MSLFCQLRTFFVIQAAVSLYVALIFYWCGLSVLEDDMFYNDLESKMRLMLF